MTIMRSWKGNGLSAGAATTGSVGTGDDAFTTVATGVNITTDGPRSPRLTYPNTAGAHTLRWNALGLGNTYAVRRQISVTAWPASALQGVMACYDSMGAALCRVDISPDGYVRLRNASTNTFTDSSAILPSGGTSLRVEIVCNAGAGSVYVYSGDSTTPLITGAGAVESGNLDEVRFGRATSLAVSGETADDLAIGNTSVLIGPAALPPTSPLYTATVNSNAGAWTANTGTIISALTDPSDTNYATTPDTPSNAAILLGLDAAPLAAGNVTIPYRARRQPPGGADATVKVELLEAGGTVRVTRTQALTDTWAAYTVVLTPLENAAIVSRTGLQLRITGDQT